MQIIKSSYDGTDLSFQANDGWFNATQAAAKFGRTPNDWLRLPSTQEYIEAVERKYGKISYLKTKRGQSGGTWLHPKLAVRFAQWLDIDFALWCDEQIETIIHGTHSHYDQRKARDAASASFKVMTEILLLARNGAGKETKSHHFMNEARLVNWALTGEFKGIDRDELSRDELALLSSLEDRNSVLIGSGMVYESRKVALKQHAADWGKRIAA